MSFRSLLMLSAPLVLFAAEATRADVVPPGQVNFCAAGAVPLIRSLAVNTNALTAGVTPTGGDIKLTVNFLTAWPTDCVAVLHVETRNQDNSNAQPRALVVPQNIAPRGGAASYVVQFITSGDDGHDLTKRLIAQTGTSTNATHAFIPVGAPSETNVQVRYNRIADFTVPTSVAGNASFNVTVRTQLPYNRITDGYAFDIDGDPADKLTQGGDGATFRSSSTRSDTAAGSVVTVPVTFANNPCGNYQARLFLDALGVDRISTRNLTVNRLPLSAAFCPPVAPPPKSPVIGH